MTGLGRIYPLPPYTRLRHGAAWLVYLEAPRRTKLVRSWEEAWRPLPGHREHLVVVALPAPGWPPNPRGYEWWRSRLVVGDLSQRSQEAILADFRTLLRQTPPARTNWRRSLSMSVYEGQRWHLTWMQEITVVV